jgi:hypothetical protein
LVQQVFGAVAGERTQVTRVTGGNTYHYTTTTISPLLNLSPHYKGTPTENPYWHIQEIVDLCKTQNVQGLTLDEIRLILFPFSLKDNAKIWYYSLAAGSIHTWDEMTTKFLKKFFPAHKTRQLRREILTF